ncbi:hypothetical protein EW026_g4714 [Hermanssonia centrifuga]|uniref:Uncharacterized protein n=1 Tax=Hermanssonia centrifuga TaxID=98765 RepID=A0A4S4KGA1_9APHY|nr:hypothetical protein EW026_g4714 [Hermanssonia centrifuga]
MFATSPATPLSILPRWTATMSTHVMIPSSPTVLSFALLVATRTSCEFFIIFSTASSPAATTTTSSIALAVPISITLTNVSLTISVAICMSSRVVSLCSAAATSASPMIAMAVFTVPMFTFVVP